ncbi:AfsR/SARP family transcriptional regulator [Actinospica sp.]|uniref:AfsR/SARP family transcriptional regulator n=1 Tax=Actinospica sp. TaxID=1872142 RepID=UPI002BD5B125|nr:BTAD domain-containing putative transcriptional regulator [Actinospica sp.]HWG23837.1 BTAD domain-containing putative transcriptional regulator [Actinospica sp.]
MRFALLGPLSAHGESGPIPVAGRLRRTLLAALLLEAGTPVSTDRLAELLWGTEALDASSMTPLHVQVMRLRHALGDEDRVRAVPPGYLIHVRPGELDLHVFAAEYAAGRQKLGEQAWAEAARRFRAALELWQGRPLADIPALADDARVRELEETYAQALQGRIEADLNLGRHHELLDELGALAAEHPRREAFRSQLMLALHRAGRPDDATAGYDAYRAALLDELGLEPSAELRELRDAIVRRDPALVLPQNPNAPHQLPADTRTFTGRVAELAELAQAAGGAARALVITALDGLGGIGKTALAVHAAHRVADRFPDGALFIDLRGHAPDVDPMSSAEALAYLLRSLGVPAQAIPPGVPERAELYRSRLADSRTLIVLDNAADGAQVEPLLPGAPGCLVLITSRGRLADLAGARALTVDILGEAEAVALLIRVAAPERELADSPALRELAELCGYVPLALRIVGARLRHGGVLTVGDLLAELRDENVRLDRLTDGERDLTSVFESSFVHLPEPEQRAMRLLGVLPGPDIDGYAAANLLGTDPETAVRLLDSLLDRSLLIQHAEGRYGLHDLVRAYARTLIDAEGAEANGARDRLYAYYEHTAWAASVLFPSAIRWHPRTEQPGPVPGLVDLPAAKVWLRRERECLFAALEHPAASPARRVDLTSALGVLLHHDGPWPQAARLHEAAAETARELGDRLAQADALRNLAQIIVWSEPAGSDRPKLVLEQATELYRAAGNRMGEADTLRRLGQVLRQRDEYAVARPIQTQALELFRELGDRHGEALTMQSLAQLEHSLFHFDEARGYARAAGAIYRELGHDQAEASTWTILGYLEYELGELTEALETFTRLLAASREHGQAQLAAAALGALGHLHSLRGEHEQAYAELTESIAVYDSLGYGFGTAFSLTWLGQDRVRAGEPAEGIRILERSRSIELTGSEAANTYHAVRELGWALHLSGDPEGRRLVEQALEHCRDVQPDVSAETDCLVYLARIAEDEGDPAAALKIFDEVVSRARNWRRGFSLAYALDGVARCHEMLGEPAAAREPLDEAVRLYRRMRLAELAEAEERLAALEN